MVERVPAMHIGSSLTKTQKRQASIAAAQAEHLLGAGAGGPITCKMCLRMPLVAGAAPVSNPGCLEFCHNDRADKCTVGKSGRARSENASLASICTSVQGFRAEVIKGQYYCSIHAQIETTHESSAHNVWGVSSASNQTRIRNAAYVNTLKLLSGCCLCALCPDEVGYASILECDHISGSKGGRENAIGALVNSKATIIRLDAELRLVRCLCSHCHMLHTAELLPAVAEASLANLTTALRTTDNNDLAAAILFAVDTARKEGRNVKSCTLAGLAAAEVFKGGVGEDDEDEWYEPAPERFVASWKAAGAAAAALPVVQPTPPSKM